MEMKWRPIENGNLSGIPRDKKLLFSYIDHNGSHVDFGYIESRLEKHEVVSIGDIELPVEAKYATAWMDLELPEPYQPGTCEICKHWKEWIDEYGDGCAKCELIVDPPFLFSTEQHFKCPLNG